MADCADVRRELLARRFALGEAPEGPAGVYAFFVDHPTALAPLAIQPNGLIYVGMTSPRRGSGARDHVECTHSGGSTLRRSLGALLKDRLQPPLKARPRAMREDPKNWQHYRFQEEGEAALTEWMKARLQMNFTVLDASREDIRACEKALIGELQPPLNLTDWANPQASQVESLRSLCAQEARGSFRTTTEPPQAFAGLPEKTGRDRYELLDEAVDDLIDKHRRKSSAPKR